MRHTDATREALSRARRGAANPMHGRRHTPEALERIAATATTRDARSRYELAPQQVVVPDGVALGYLAGLLDGEGSVRFRNDRGRPRPFVAIYGERVIVDWLLERVGGKIGKPDTRGRVPCYCWTVQGARDVYALCVALRPLVNLKGADIDAVIEALEVRYGFDDVY